ncbi:uncharacterized protein E0L32_011604 [Thyridium curvatum]|uniref:VOC domain-containing protein n=1 Tax=Thyridium curvatum TaxID=1093900 RepID=A0A507BMP9_9PEZI|nr:uncharacterized protein E0L32_011604 [Thyridium curvatum]TPX18491.1 hypothetical protein E0L32_011604 [Thyridium curvatum]
MADQTQDVQTFQPGSKDVSHQRNRVHDARSDAINRTTSGTTVHRIVPNLVVSDIRSAAAEYQAVFGLDVLMDHGWIATLGDPTGRLQLSLMTQDATGPVNPSVSIFVDDVDEVEARVRAEGLEIVHLRTEEAWGVTRFFYRDRHGNVVNVGMHTPAATAAAAAAALETGEEPAEPRGTKRGGDEQGETGTAAKNHHADSASRYAEILLTSLTNLLPEQAIFSQSPNTSTGLCSFRIRVVSDPIPIKLPMAEVLGIIGSGIALGQAAGLIGKGVKLLRSIARANEEFWDLLNDLDTLKAAIDTNSSALEEIDGKDDPNLQPILAALARSVHELNSIATRLLSKSKGLNAQGQHRIPKLLWQKEKPAMSEHLTKCRQYHQQLSSSMQSIFSVRQQRLHGSLALEVHAIMSTSTALLNQQATSGQLRETESHMKDRMESMELASRRQTQDLAAQFDTRFSRLEQALAQTRPEPGEGCPDTSQHKPSPISIYTTVRRKCEPGCRCQCHIYSEMKSPPWLRSVLGSFFLRYNALPLLDRRPCNTNLCKQSKKAISVQYQLPSWLISSAIHVGVGWDSFLGTGAHVYWKVPRVNDANVLAVAMYHDNFNWVRAAISARFLQPNDIRETGRPWVLQCFQSHAYKTLIVLLENGFDPWMTDVNGRNCINSIYPHMMSTPNVPQALVDMMRHLVDEDELGFTTIHRCVLGLSPEPIRSVIASHPCELHTFDNMGLAPLHWAVRSRNTEAFHQLLQAGCDINIRERATGNTAVFTAVELHSPVFAEELIRRKANVNIPSFHGYTPLHEALRHPMLETAELLLDSGASLFAKSFSDQCSPIHCLGDYSGGLEDAEAGLRLLQQHGVDIEVKDVWGRTPLALALIYRKLHAALVLAKAGAKFDSVDLHNETLLHHLAKSKAPEHLYHLDAFYWDGIDPDLGDGFDSMSPLGRLRSKCRSSSGPLKKTVYETISLAELIVEIRERNWARGLFLGKRLAMECDRSHEKLKKWIRAWQEVIKEEPSLAYQDWDPGRMPWIDEMNIEGGYQGGDSEVDIHALTLRKPRETPSLAESQSDDETIWETTDEEDEFHDALEEPASASEL